MLVIVIAIIAGLAGYYAGGGFGGTTPPGPPARLIIGTNTPFPPFEFRNATTDVIEGFDIDLIGEVLDRIGYTSTEWDLFDFRDFTALLAAVGVNSVNIAVSAITMNGDIGTDRNATMDFTNPYYESDQGVLQRSADA
ncbi:MAG TPA: transporter substrate-binding domain-containing protein, partial [Thermoplasmata archaeon]|nr:transporter substrate-binding domain-containing protein [Thermoplasmata archaeon]